MKKQILPKNKSVIKSISEGETPMTKKAKIAKEIEIKRPERMKLSAEESLKRTKEFDKRKGKFIAAIRQAKN